MTVLHARQNGGKGGIYAGFRKSSHIYVQKICTAELCECLKALAKARLKFSYVDTSDIDLMKEYQKRDKALYIET